MGLKYYFDKIFNTIHLINEIDNLTMQLKYQTERASKLSQQVDNLSNALRNFYPIISITKNYIHPFVEEENEQYIISVADLCVSFKVCSKAPQDVKEMAFRQALRDLGETYLKRSLDKQKSNIERF